MKTKYILIRICWLFLLTNAVFLDSCQKSTELATPRLFRPIVSANATKDNELTISWTPITGSVSYIIEISRDSFATIDQSVTVQSDTSTLTIKNLLAAQKYYVGIQAINSNPTLSSKQAVISATTLSILNNPGSTDILDIELILRWISRGDSVTSVKVFKASNDSLVSTFPIPKNAPDTMLITGLKGATTYFISIYSGSVLRGKGTYSTKPSLAGNVVDLRPVTFRSTLLYDTLSQISPNSIVILKRGYTYNIPSALSLSKSVTFISGYDFINSQATIFLTNNFDIVAGSAIDSIVFMDVALATNDATTKYIFNVHNSATIGKIDFESCRIQIVRGLTRLQTGTTLISTYKVNNCVIDSIGNYGLVTVDNTTSSINDIIVQNSTVYKAEKIVVSAKANSNSITLTNCTFNETPLGGNYLVDCNTYSVAQGITVNNCILGVGKNNAGSNAVKGIRASATTLINCLNSYNTSDYVLTATSPYPIPNLIAYSGSSTTLFKNPGQGDFTIVDKSFAGKSSAGDPRWR